MSSGIVEKDKDVNVKIEIQCDLELEYVLSKMIVPFTYFLEVEREPDIYNGKELMSFSQRHSTYKALMLIEFEEVIKDFSKIIKTKK